MSEQAITQIVAVLVGGLLAIGGGFVTTTLLDRQRRGREARNLALAFKGEITALLTLIAERRYVERFAEVTQQIESSQQPFYMPVQVRFQYGRVYDSNVEKIGMLSGSLPELVPLFYTRLNSVLEDLVNLGEGMYTSLDLPILLRIYRDMHRILAETVALGERIVGEIDSQYR